MTITEQRPTIAGQELHQLILSPEAEVKERGGLLFFHGQGDFIDRYPPILERFVKAGYRCLLTDLPGHGRSPGQRGEVPSMEVVEKLFESSIAQLSGPLVLAGHSMGGLLALRFLLLHPDKFSAAWISSPLLDPMHQAKPWMRATLPSLSRLFPRVTVSTGVRSTDCGDDPGRSAEEEKPLYHSRISLAWGRHLRDTADQVAAHFQDLPTDRPILFTQGTLDPICPPQILRTRLAQLPTNQISYQEIPEARHEPFSGSSEADFLARLDRWITSEL